MNLTKIDKLITYLSVLREIVKVKDSVGDKYGGYKSVDIVFPEGFEIIERWNGGASELFWEIQFPVEDIDNRIKSSKDHLRYIKKRTSGVSVGE